MDKSELGIRIKELRNQKGMSQEFLADESGLSLRTIQRVENGESNPTGESLKRIASALNVAADDLMDWAIKEDRRYLIYLNLSAMTFLVFPFLGILIPFILWTAKKGKIKDINQVGKELINFQITWNLLLFFIPLTLFILSKTGLIEDISLRSFLILFALMYAYNLMSILINTLRISNDNNPRYFPQIRFLR